MRQFWSKLYLQAAVNYSQVGHHDEKLPPISECSKVYDRLIPNYSTVDYLFSVSSLWAAMVASEQGSYNR